MADDNQIDPTFFNFVAQVAHCAATYTVALTTFLFLGWVGYAVAATLVVIYAALHEFIYDPSHENAATRGSDWEDFCFLLLGPILAGGVAWIHGS